MAEENKAGTAGSDQNQAQNQGEAGPALVVLHQFLKDFSFENPLGADTPQGMTEAPTGMIRVDVKVKPLTPPDIEVTLFLSVDAKIGEKSVYLVECEYSGSFRLGRVPQEHVLPLVMIEAPRLLFPFARQFISNAVQAGGFPPLLINPIDFVALYRDKREELLKQAEAQKAAQGAATIGNA
ncbi:protein translocase subunit secB [Dongia mobilis]|uniref:Protein-export protein SecB n=1 Tax=Dongia mobilis TaxID=578943 RepID=A0A4R6WR14_9PROT|nr:protein-export chaperone SecB [Dongia mobilis]TDQ82246.1 protein translocase subunit secB [Dongia mobilis]